MAAYVDHLHEIGRAPGVIKLAICAIRFRAKAFHKPDPVGVETRNALKKSTREGAGRGKDPAPGLTLEQVESIIRKAESDGDLWGIRDASLIAVQFYCGLRISEVAALQVSDVFFAADGTGVVRIRKSKTDQNSVGASVFLPSDGAKWVQKWLNVSGLQSAQLFRVIYGRNSVGRSMRPGPCATVVKERAAEVGFAISSHSLRRSFAQWLTREGGSLQQVQVAGRWTCPTMVARYTANEQAAQSFVRNISEKKNVRHLKAV